MSSFCKHINWLVNTGEELITSDGRHIDVFAFRYGEDSPSLSSLAHHLRNHYCSDSEIDILRSGTGLSRTDYLNSRKFPTASQGFGPGIRAGDFGEILIADYLEFKLGYWVPRTRYDRKTIQNESTKGSDVIGFRVAGSQISSEDVLCVFEVKTQFSGVSSPSRLQEAVNDSVKDEVRKAESLNAIKQRLLDRNRLEDIEKVARFQSPVDNPYKEQLGAAALFSTSAFDRKIICSTSVKCHPTPNELTLIVIYGEDLMNLVHRLYEIAANEA